MIRSAVKSTVIMSPQSRECMNETAVPYIANAAMASVVLTDDILVKYTATKKVWVAPSAAAASASQVIENNVRTTAQATLLR